MNRPLLFLYCATVSALAVTGLAVSGGAALAQDQNDAVEEIVIEAPTVVRRTVMLGRESYELTEFMREVEYSDLDLTKTRDVTKLEERIQATAEAVCQELADMFPPLDRPEPSCIRNAVASAREQMDAVVATANE